jgi:hypothetical protein
MRREMICPIIGMVTYYDIVKATRRTDEERETIYSEAC